MAHIVASEVVAQRTVSRGSFLAIIVGWMAAGGVFICGVGAAGILRVFSGVEQPPKMLSATDGRSAKGYSPPTSTRSLSAARYEAVSEPHRPNRTLSRTG
jgi:hypothetical protein